MTCFRLFLAALCACLMTATAAMAEEPLLAPGDPVLAIDFDLISNSSYPGGEAPMFVLDATPGTKYLNFGRRNTGVIVTPAFGASQVQSFVLTTAGDAPERDPASWSLYGTHDAIVSADNSDGSGESWTLIDSGTVTLPDTRLTIAAPVSVTNGSMYSSYRFVFPTVKDDFAANSMQVADVGFYQSSDGTGTNVLAVGDDIRAVMLPAPQSRYPAAEAPAKLFDGDTGTKYLNFGKENSGLIVSRALGPSLVTSFQMTTANDSPSRDPASWMLYGTNDPIASTNNSLGDGESWTLIDQGALNLPMDRMMAGDVVPVSNSTYYASYRMVFPTIRDTAAPDADSLQFSGLQMYGVPEPSSIALAFFGVATVLVGCARRRLAC
jgi:hypothetical protein